VASELGTRFSALVARALDVDVTATRVVWFPSDGRQAEQLFDGCRAPWTSEGLS